MSLEKKRIELQESNIQLRQMSEQLQRSNRELEVFAFASSHDLKEPLRMIGTYTQLINKRLKGQLTAETEEMMGFVREGVTRMQRLIEDILEFSQAGKSKDKMADIDLDDVFFYVKSNLKMKLSETNAQILIPNDLLPKVFARYSEMVQLFQNLISNSIKYCDKDKSPIIEITWTETKDQYLFQLKDNGIGIEPQYHEKVFQLFEKLHNRSIYDGSGIGLATCKKIVENFGGHIWLTSQIGEGTIFHFTLPRNAEAYEKVMQLYHAHQENEMTNASF